MLELALLVVFPGLMAYAAASDLITMTIPNRLSLALIVAFAGVAVIGGLTWHAVLMHVAAGALILSICFGLFALGWVGGGDAKLAAVTALWLGFGPLVEYLFIAAIGGGFLTLGILSMRGLPLPGFALGWGWLSRLHDRSQGVPYGIALAGAALIVYPRSPIWTALLGS